MEIAEHLNALRGEGERIAMVAETAAPSSPVPGCPGWDLEALVRHIGDVHRWAAKVVGERLQERLRRDFEGPSDMTELIAWYRQGHAQLLDVLGSAGPDEQFWAWGPAPSPVAFWARRQAHETAVHRLDAEQAAGLDARFDDPAMAVDGIDEWLTLAWRSRSRAVPGGGSRSLRIRATDTTGEWTVRLHDHGLEVVPVVAEADCVIRGPAGDLFAVVMNRRGADGLDVGGDADVLRVWREEVRF